MQTPEEQIIGVRKANIHIFSTFMILFGLVVIASFCSIEYSTYEKIESTKSWIQTKAIIKKQDLFATQFGKSPTTYTCLYLSVMYLFNGKNYEVKDEGSDGRGVELRDHSDDIDTQAKIEAQIRHDYPIGGSISILFNPQKLEQVMTVTELNNLRYDYDNSKIFLWGGIVILVAGLLNLLRLLW